MNDLYSKEIQMLISTYKNQFDNSISIQTNQLNSLNLLRFNKGGEFKIHEDQVHPQHLKTMIANVPFNNYGQGHQQYLHSSQKRNTVTETVGNQYRLMTHNQYLQA